ncbi:MAG: exported protein of unknown function [Candidatus Saccharibacteria bacterium]|nr:exported protein of unknown function [Candidatus Saccharibacteria bacterium]
MKTIYRHYERGAVTASLIIAIILGVFTIGFAATTIWAYLSYTEQKTDVDGKTALAQAEAKKTQADEDEKKFAEREKEPNREFVGPDDYGRLTFNYPKTWSAYIAKDAAAGGTFEAYFNPVTVPTVSATQQFSLRVTISEQEYDKVLTTYDGLIKKGDLKSSPTSVNGQNGTRLDGSFSKDIRGAAVFYKIRDKTLQVQTDADVFKPDFENLIKTIKFNT